MTCGAISFSLNEMALTPRRKRLTVPREMELASSVGPALRTLRKAAGLTQQALADRAQVGFAMISRYERGSELPQLATLGRLLSAMSLDFGAFARALEPSALAPVSVGKPRPAWVSLLVRNGVEPRVLEGAAVAATMEAAGASDLVASAMETARQMAEAAVAEVRRAELSLVAESPAEYDATKGPKR